MNNARVKDAILAWLLLLLCGCRTNDALPTAPKPSVAAPITPEPGIVVWPKWVTIAFDPSTDSRVTGYRIYYQNGGVNVVEIGPEATFTVTNLPPETPLTFWAVGLSGGFETDASNEYKYTTKGMLAVIYLDTSQNPNGPWTVIVTNVVPAEAAKAFFNQRIRFE